MENKGLIDIIRVFIMSFGATLSSINDKLCNDMLILVAFMTIDYITGIIVSYYHKSLSSKVGFKGILKKFAILCIVAIAAIIGTYIFQSDALKIGVTMYYISNEGISILENCSNIGIPIPKHLKNALLKADEESRQADNKQQGE